MSSGGGGGVGKDDGSDEGGNGDSQPENAVSKEFKDFVDESGDVLAISIDGIR